MWIEAVEYILAAKRRLEMVAAKEPGDYHLWDSSTHKFVNPFTKSAPSYMTRHGKKSSRRLSWVLVVGWFGSVAMKRNRSLPLTVNAANGQAERVFGYTQYLFPVSSLRGE